MEARATEQHRDSEELVVWSQRKSIGITELINFNENSSSHFTRLILFALTIDFETELADEAVKTTKAWNF